MTTQYALAPDDFGAGEWLFFHVDGGRVWHRALVDRPDGWATLAVPCGNVGWMLTYMGACQFGESVEYQRDRPTNVCRNCERLAEATHKRFERRVASKAATYARCKQRDSLSTPEPVEHRA